MNNEKSLTIAIIAIMFSVLILPLVFVKSCEVTTLKHEAIKYNYARYNGETGRWEWKEPAEPASNKENK